MKRTKKQIGSLLLSVCMVFTMQPTAAFAEESSVDYGTLSSTSKITAFADLAEEVALQEVKSGTTEKELNLPSTLTVTVTTGSAITATVSDEDAATDNEAQKTATQEETTMVVSEWTADPAYDGDTVGDYVYTPTLNLPDDTMLADGVTLPQITVTVKAADTPMLLGAGIQAFGTDIDITTEFPDANFLAQVRKALGKAADEPIYDTDDFASVMSWIISGRSITSLEGIEYFTELTSLNCYNNQLTELDVSKNTKLTSLSCAYNKLTDLDVSKNTALTSLNCGNNDLTDLDVSMNIALTSLLCDSNDLTYLDVSNNTALTYLKCDSNNLTELNVSKNTSLDNLNCNSNELTELDVSKNTALIYLYCNSNQLTELDVSSNAALVNLYCNSNQLTKLDVLQNTVLTYLGCSLNYMTGESEVTGLDKSRTTTFLFDPQKTRVTGVTLDQTSLFLYSNTSPNTANLAITVTPADATDKSVTWQSSNTSVVTVDTIGKITAIGNGTATITVTTIDGGYTASCAVTVGSATDITAKFEDAKFLAAVRTALSKGVNDPIYDTDNFASVTSLSINNRSIISLVGIEYFTALTYLNCSDNELTELDVSNNTALTDLYCYYNELTELDLSNNTALTDLYCSNNYIPGKSAVTGIDESLIKNFYFDPQKTRVTGVTLNQTSFFLYSNTSPKTANTTITVTPADATDKSVTWQSSNTSVATVDASGKITAIGNGTATITVTTIVGGYTASCAVTVGSATDITAKFEDVNFLAEVRTTLGKGVNDPIYDSSDFASVTSLRIDSKGISSLTGIEYFTKLIDLNCSNNELTELDVSKNTELEGLDCSNNKLTELDVSKNIALEYLFCSNNELTKLDVSKNTKLIDLECSNNELTKLDVSKNTKLIDLECSNNELTELDVSKNTELYDLDCDNNKLTELDVSKNTELGTLYCFNNELTKLSVNKGIGTLDCSLNYLTNESAITGLDKSLTSHFTFDPQKSSNTVTITQHPQDVTVQEGGTATFTITADNATSYQWMCAGSEEFSDSIGVIHDTPNKASGATTATLTIHNVTKANGASIFCYAYGEGNSEAMSNVAFLTVSEGGDITERAITVNSGTADKISASSGKTVIITANSPESGKRFKEWTVISGGVTLANAQASSTTFAMPTNAVEITATYEDIPVGVTPVTGVSLNRNNLSLYSNTTPNTATLTATVAPASATDKSVIWQSSNTAVATVDVSGNLRAVRNGTATITVATTDGNYTASCTVTVSIYTSGGDSPSGGNSGGSSPSSDSATKAIPVTGNQPNLPNLPVTAATPITAKAGTNGAASASIPDNSIADAITKAQADVKEQGKTTNGVSIALDVTMPKEATALTATLSRNALNSLVSAGVTNLEINGSPVTVTFDQEALTEIQKKSSGNINITIAPETNLSKMAKKMIGTRPVYNITVNYGKNSTVSSFGNGVVTLAIPYTPANGEVIGGLYVIYVDEKGNVARVEGSVYDVNSGCVMFTTPHFSVYGIGYTVPSVKFADINSHWAKESIDYMVGRGLLSGTTETTFAPDTAITREMLVTAIGRLAGVDVSSYTTSSFTDVKVGSTFQPYIEWAYKKGMMQGIGNNQFAPDRAITREEIAVIIENFAKATGYTLPVTREVTVYADAYSMGSTYKIAVTAMQQAGIMMGGTSNKFNPKSYATRAEVSSMLYRYIKLTIDPDTAQGWAQNDAGQWLYYKEGKALTGTQTINGVKYFFYSNGILQVGWVSDGDNLRYNYGNKALVGWLDIGANGSNKTYYFNKNGIMMYGKWLKIDGKWYYFYTYGSLAKSTKIDDYEVDENGVRKTK